MNAGTCCLNPVLFWYVLDQLHYSAWAFAWLGVANWAALYSSTYAWGALADRVGAKRILTLSGIGLLGVPLLLLGSNALWWIALVQIYDGFISAAYNIGATNYLFDAVTPPKRARCTAYNTLFVALGVAAGVSIGMFVANGVTTPVHIGPFTLTHAFQAVVIASAAIRLLGVLLVGSFPELRLSRPVFTGAPYGGSA
jgi:MFS family permease